MKAMKNHTTSLTQGQTPDYKPQTYEDWKAAHGWQPEAEPRLEIGQRVKATREIDTHNGYTDYPLDVYIPEGTQGTIERLDTTKDSMYLVWFDTDVRYWAEWINPDTREDSYLSDIQPVGKSPSQLAYEQSERERLSAWQQLSLFDAAQTGGAS